MYFSLSPLKRVTWTHFALITLCSGRVNVSSLVASGTVTEGRKTTYCPLDTMLCTCSQLK